MPAEEFDTRPPEPGTLDEICGRFNPHPAHRWTQRPQMEPRWCSGREADALAGSVLTPAQTHRLLADAITEQRRRRRKTAHPQAGAEAARMAELKRQRKRKRNREIAARRRQALPDA